MKRTLLLFVLILSIMPAVSKVYVNSFDVRDEKKTSGSTDTLYCQSHSDMFDKNRIRFDRQWPFVKYERMSSGMIIVDDEEAIFSAQEETIEKRSSCFSIWAIVLMIASFTLVYIGDGSWFYISHIKDKDDYEALLWFIICVILMILILLSVCLIFMNWHVVIFALIHSGIGTVLALPINLVWRKKMLKKYPEKFRC